MESSVWITDMAAVTALGESLDALWPRLLAGESAIGPVTRFDTSRLDVNSAACVADLERGAFPNRTCALMGRCLDGLGPVPRETFVIWAGVKSDAEWVEEMRNAECGMRNESEMRNAECGMRNEPAMRIAECGLRNEPAMRNAECGMRNEIPPEGGTPKLTTHNSQLIPHSAFRIPHFYAPIHYRRWITARLGTTGAGMEINAACASSAAGLALGSMMIQRGQAGAVLVCAADLVTHFTFTGFAALRGLTATVCRPLDAGRDGLALGDGAVAMSLMSDGAMRAAGTRPLARLAGWGLANDATHITAPARDGCGLIAAIRNAECGMRNAECGNQYAIRNPQSAIGAWCVHGTGTVYNDAMELTALEAVFGDEKFPIFSIKGAVGHTLGAAGALEAAVCVKALCHGIVPPTAGLANPEPRAEGRASAITQELTGSTILTTNSGFGGVNAALILEKIYDGP